MSEDVAARLRTLARDHREGRLNVSAYRKLRAPLLDSLAGEPAAQSATESGVITQPRAGNGERAAKPAFRAKQASPKRDVRPSAPKPAAPRPAPAPPST